MMEENVVADEIEFSDDSGDGNFSVCIFPILPFVHRN